MADYGFDQIIDRHNTNSYKWDSVTGDDVLPMWVADMDFRTAPCIIEALRRRVDHGIFGYTRVPDRYYDAVIEWFGRRHGWSITRDMILYTSGVVPAISAGIKGLTKPGDKVVVQTPVYNCFFSSIRNNGCEIVENPLVYENGRYRMDYTDLEKKVADPDVRLFLLCNPHNPAGRVWSAEELEQLNAICMRHNVMVVSDEIHCELVFPGYRFTPFASISAECLHNSVTCNSPSKAFNTAGLQIANIISASQELRERIDRAININEVCDVNPFGVEALIAAYTEGEGWLKALIEYIYKNYLTLCDYFSEHLPQLHVTLMEGTYLVWVDCRSLGMSSDDMEHELMVSERLWLNSGTMYGTDGFMRINIACPRSRMLEGLERLKNYVNGLKRTAKTQS